MTNATFQAAKPSEIEFELRVSMPLKDWLELYDNIDSGEPHYTQAGKLRAAISDLARKANEQFSAEIQDER